MVARSFTKELAELPADGKPLRVVVGWDAQNTEAIEFAAWLGRSLPVKVKVLSAVEGTWKKPLSGKKYKRWFRDRAQEFELQAKRVLKAHIPRAISGQKTSPSWQSAPMLLGRYIHALRISRRT